MRSVHAPPVSRAVGRSSWAGLALLSLGLGSLLVAVLWRWQAPSESLAPWLGLGATGLSAVGLLIGWRRQPQGCLSWESGEWLWQPDSGGPVQTLAAAEPALDLQSLLLIRLVPRQGRPFFVWADAASDPPSWLDLRRALHAQPHNQAQDVTAPSAPP